MNSNNFSRLIVFFLVFFVFFPLVNASYMNCAESDGGAVFNVFGDINYSFVSVPLPGEIYHSFDYCTIGYSPAASCTGSDCYINEYSCGGTPYNWTVDVNKKTCISLGYTGCADGECYGSAASCSDLTKNQTETDIDCGGICGATCEIGEHCLAHSDCVNYYCNDEVCSTAPAIDAHCYNGVKDLDETGIDCGGAYCHACFAIVFGRGSNDPGSHSWVTTDNAFNVMFQLMATAEGGTVDFRGLTLEGSGTGNEKDDIAYVIVVIDKNNNGKYEEATDTLIGKESFVEDNGIAKIVFSSVQSLVATASADKTVNYLVVYKMNSTPSNGETFTMQLVSAEAKFPSSSVFANDLETSYFRNTKTVSAYTQQNNCTNGIRDYDELGVDCGGAYCPACDKPSLDIEIGEKDPGNHSWNAGEAGNNVMMQLKFTAHEGAVSVSQVSLQAKGTGDDLQDIEKVLVVLDKENDGIYNGTETILGSGTYNNDNGQFVVTFNNPLKLNGLENESARIMVVYDLKNSVQAGETFELQIASVTASAADGNESLNLGKWLADDSTFSNVKKIIGTTTTTETGTSTGTCNTCVPCCNAEGVAGAGVAASGARSLCISFSGACDNITCWLFVILIILVILVLLVLLFATIVGMFRGGGKQVVQIKTEKQEKTERSQKD